MHYNDILEKIKEAQTKRQDSWKQLQDAFYKTFGSYGIQVITWPKQQTRVGTNELQHLSEWLESQKNQNTFKIIDKGGNTQEVPIPWKLFEQLKEYQKLEKEWDLPSHDVSTWQKLAPDNWEELLSHYLKHLEAELVSAREQLRNEEEEEEDY